MSAIKPLGQALRALSRHPAVLLPAVGVGLVLAPGRFLRLVGGSEAAVSTANTVQVVAYLAVPYFLGLVVEGGASALDGEGPSVRDVFAPKSHYLGILLAGVIVGFGTIVGGFVAAVGIAAVDAVGLLLLLLPLGVIVATQFYPVFVVRTDAGVVGSLMSSISLFEMRPLAVLQFSVVAFGLWVLPDLLVVALLLEEAIPGPGWVRALQSTTSPEVAVGVALATAGLTAFTVAVRWTYAVAFCRENA